MKSIFLHYCVLVTVMMRRESKRHFLHPQWPITRKMHHAHQTDMRLEMQFKHASRTMHIENQIPLGVFPVCFSISKSWHPTCSSCSRWKWVSAGSCHGCGCTKSGRVVFIQRNLNCVSVYFNTNTSSFNNIRRVKDLQKSLSSVANAFMCAELTSPSPILVIDCTTFANALTYQWKLCHYGYWRLCDSTRSTPCRSELERGDEALFT